ncbi:Zn-dependent hydrolase [Fusarium albosuccineum]|uniref:Zn-dependent hydrolase n=1 Tax=Fusarium albosuccineum TaxID=1237068 RepID=A0A8H4PHV6_9HYPO|nr:Zn-dependent hydrolase [Fusarium albosuccineum]KAF5012094.1 hypothetical protein FDECE_1811 [Fusarium decemcellulare]
MAAIQSQISHGAVPGAVSNVCPIGTKFHVLEVGWLECDEGFVTRGGNTSLKCNETNTFVNKRRQMPMYCILVDHPHEGLILWDTGSGRDYPEVWGPQIAEIFARIKYEPKHELRAAVEATGHKLEDVKKIIISHLHLDHAGGLDEFYDNTEVEVWVHENEFHSAFWSNATGADAAVYLAHYLKLSFNWKTFTDQTFDFCQGITLHHLPGHTDGLIGMQINMPDTGTFVFISDHCHVIENWRDGIPQGWLARDHPAWFRSYQRLKQLERTTKGLIVPGHDEGVYLKLIEKGTVFT